MTYNTNKAANSLSRKKKKKEGMISHLYKLNKNTHFHWTTTGFNNFFLQLILFLLLVLLSLKSDKCEDSDKRF